MTTTTAIPLPVLPGFRVKDCPPSEVAAMFVQWTGADGSLNVAAGDLTILNGQLVTIAEIDDSDAAVIWFWCDGDTSAHGYPATQEAGRGDWVAILRYVTDGGVEATGSTEAEGQAAA